MSGMEMSFTPIHSKRTSRKANTKMWTSRAGLRVVYPGIRCADGLIYISEKE